MIIFWFVLGCCFGSFVNVVISRKDWYKGRSRCDSCNHIIHWYDLIPVISYTFLMGKCRYCKGKINPIHTISEVIMGVGFAVSSLYIGKSEAVMIFITSGFLSVLSIMDIKEKCVNAKLLYIAIISIFIVKSLNYAGTELVIYVAKSIMVYVIFLAISKLSEGYIGDGDFDVFMIIYLCVGFLGLFRSLTVASIIGICVYIPAIVTKKMNRKQSIPFIPLLYAGFLFEVVEGMLL